jgi:2,4'-dihydroxyacetophenone dioxygenase
MRTLYYCIIRFSVMTACGGEHSQMHFKFQSDGLDSSKRARHEYVVNTDIHNEKLWIPYGEGAFQACSFNVTSGGFSNLLRLPPGTKLNPHYHVGIVNGYTIQGQWGYLEHPWRATAGTYIYEPPGEMHTLVSDGEEDMITFFHLQGGLIYVDNMNDGNMVGYDDGFTLLEIARAHYAKEGLDMSQLNGMIR